MSKTAVSLFLFTFSLSAGAQCDCSSKFTAIKYEMEHNYAGFRDKVNDATKNSYEQLTKEMQDKAKTSTNDAYCMALLDKWLKFFKDNHVQLDFSSSSWLRNSDTAAIYTKASKAKVLTISDEKLTELMSRKEGDAEGIYYTTPDTNYTIAILKDKNEFRDLAGVIISSKNPYWKPGQVKLEFQKPASGNVYPIIFHDRDHNSYPTELTFHGSYFGDEDWVRMGYTSKMQGTQQERPQPVSLKKISDKTLYIKILSFNSRFEATIDSVLKANESLLNGTPNVILDLRDNGGGADLSYAPLLPYLYTQPVIRIGNDVLASADNIKRKKAQLEDPDLPKEIKKIIRNSVSQMEKRPGSFVMQAGDGTSTYKKVLPFPQKVAILINQHCGSSTEQFLLDARQSKKVTLMGEHTSGTLDYSNMLSADLPCKDLTFKYSSTRSRRIDVGQGIDNAGIVPAIILTEDKDWIKQAQIFLEEGK